MHVLSRFASDIARTSKRRRMATACHARRLRSARVLCARSTNFYSQFRGDIIVRSGLTRHQLACVDSVRGAPLQHAPQRRRTSFSRVGVPLNTPVAVQHGDQISGQEAPCHGLSVATPRPKAGPRRYPAAFPADAAVCTCHRPQRWQCARRRRSSPTAGRAVGPLCISGGPACICPSHLRMLRRNYNARRYAPASRVKRFSATCPVAA
jgi:hypothetical protein